SLPPAVERLRALFAPEPEEAPEPTPSVADVLASGTYDPGRRGALALVAVGVVAALVAGFVLLRGRSSEQPLAVPAVAGGVTSAAGPQLVVDVEGKVRRPGLVRLPDGARVDDAVKAAGGVLPGVSTASLNLAQKVSDGQQVLVGLDMIAGGGPGGTSAGGLLDLNLASVDDFDGLPGIGPVLAQRIIDWRTEHGRFASVDQLQEVSGIGSAKYSSIKSKVRV
ncbi:MAG: helix-hairpin-helix domain-containing protein, partial [Actinomycetota bacterium]|nr:helix-hairpin-helix domain-containing protein [Actinomycetota bacterium]